jgi:two-component system sensor histidine kinase CiaH
MAKRSLLTNSFKIKRLRTIYILYWFLLAYIIAALIWWFIALKGQNQMMTDYKLSELNPAKQDDQTEINKIKDERRRKTAQYIGEGSTFFLLIVVGAVVVFRAVRRQFKLSQQQQNFMMAITHELKTPIAITKLNLETLQKHKLSEEQQQQLISNTLQEAGRLNTLCNNLLLLSQMEAGEYTITTEKIDLTELVTESTNDFKLRFPKRNIGLFASDDIYLTGDRMLLQMAVILKKENDAIKLLVKDGGKGIPDDEKDNIFKKFYRIGNEYTKGAKGTGLGLYVTKKIIEQHNGRIKVKDNIPYGSIFEVKL